MSTLAFYPWQQDIAQQWLGQRERFAHAWLIHGQEGIGKLSFCIAAAKALLCENPQQGMACEHCQSCHWMNLNHHLDYRLVLPDALKAEMGLDVTDAEPSDESAKLSTEIRIEQIRQLEEFISVSTLRGGYRVIVLGPAESLNTASSNAILKILEEPSKGTIFLIFTHAIQKVLPTILSRCRRLALPIPNTNEALAWLGTQGLDNPALWLASSSGAPLKALAQSQSPIEPLSYWLEDLVNTLAQGRLLPMDTLVEKLEKIKPSEVIRTLLCLVSDLCFVQQALAPRFYPMLETACLQIAQRVPASKLTTLYTFLSAQQKIADHPFNQKLFLQSTLQKVMLTCLK